MTSIRVKGLDKALKNIERKGERAVNAVIHELGNTASEIDLDAKIMAPNEIEGKKLNIKQRIKKVATNRGLNWKIFIRGSKDFDAYVEFGTGQSARQILNSPKYTSEMRDLARRFYKNGKGRLIGKPFLMPSWVKNTSNLVTRVKKRIDEALKR